MVPEKENSYQNRSKLSTGSTSSTILFSSSDSSEDEDLSNGRMAPNSRKDTDTQSLVRIHISGLSLSVTRRDIVEKFRPYGRIRMVEFPKRERNVSFRRGFAYVEYHKSYEADRAIIYMDGAYVKGQRIRCALAFLPPLARYDSLPRFLYNSPPRYRRRSPSRFRRRSPPRCCRQTPASCRKGSPPWYRRRSPTSSRSPSSLWERHSFSSSRMRRYSSSSSRSSY